MRQGIHPDYVEAIFKCACGAELKTMSTIGNVSSGICSKCHPFYTGRQTQLNVAGRAERFRQKYNRKKANMPSPAA